MFTLSQIQMVHAKVKTGADFPAYAQELYNLGVTSYDTFVADGRSEYLWNPEVLVSPAKYGPLSISWKVDQERFEKKLRLHQSWGSDYMTFCQDCADCGVEKWTLDLVEKTCTYFDISGKNLLVEHFKN